MLKFGNTYLNFGGSYLSGYKVPTYNVILQQSEGGIIGASPLTGSRNTEVTLSNTPSQDYVFNGYELSGANLYDTNKFKFVDSDVTAMAKWSYDGPNPLNLPPYTIRLKYKDGVTPTFASGTGVQVSSNPNIWDLTYENNNWNHLFSKSNHSSLIEVLGANTTNVTDMSYMFYRYCTALSSVSLFDTSNVTNMGYMFYECGKLVDMPLFNTSNVSGFNQAFYACSSMTNIPLFDTSKVTTMRQTFYNCYSVHSGALALYQQASTQAVPPSDYLYCFRNCGARSETGSAELAQIPASWK